MFPFDKAFFILYDSQVPVVTGTMSCRYQFFLQLKLDLLDGRLECPTQTAVELAALCLQCEYLNVVNVQI